MDFSQAIDFFYRYGNVGKRRDDLLTAVPTEDQLEEACYQAELRGQPPERIKAAAHVIRIRGLAEKVST